MRENLLPTGATAVQLGSGEATSDASGSVEARAKIRHP